VLGRVHRVDQVLHLLGLLAEHLAQRLGDRDQPALRARAGGFVGADQALDRQLANGEADACFGHFGSPGLSVPPGATWWERRWVVVDLVEMILIGARSQNS